MNTETILRQNHWELSLNEVSRKNRPSWRIEMSSTASASLEQLCATFDRHNHPLVVVEWHALRWMAAAPLVDRSCIDLLVRPSTGIIASILSLPGWCEYTDYSDIDYLPCQETFDLMRVTDGNHMFTLWPESVYGLSIDCAHVRVPAFAPLNDMLAEASMHPTDRRTDFPMCLTETDVVNVTTEIYVPTIATLLKACIGQRQRWGKLGYRSGPQNSIDLLIRYLFLESEHQRQKLKKAMEEEVWLQLEKELDRYVRLDKATGNLSRGGKPVTSRHWRQVSHGVGN